VPVASQLLRLQQQVVGVPAVSGTDAYPNIGSAPDTLLLAGPQQPPLFGSAAVIQQHQLVGFDASAAVSSVAAALGVAFSPNTFSPEVMSCGLPPPALAGRVGMFAEATHDWPQLQLQQCEVGNSGAAAAAAAAAIEAEQAMVMAASMAMCNSTSAVSDQLLSQLLGDFTRTGLYGICCDAGHSICSRHVQVNLDSMMLQQPMQQLHYLHQQEHQTLLLLQQQLTLELDQASWSVIAADSGWQSIARVTGAQIDMQVQRNSLRLLLTVTGTAAQVAMVRELITVLLQRTTG
jgi:hypothetical protein